jgi:hypothetical protein
MLTITHGSITAIIRTPFSAEHNVQNGSVIKIIIFLQLWSFRRKKRFLIPLKKCVSNNANSQKLKLVTNEGGDTR